MPKEEDKFVPANQRILRKKIIDFLIFRQSKDEKFLGPVTDSNYRQNKGYFNQVIIELRKLRGICAGSSAVKARSALISRYQKDDKNNLPIHNNDWFKRTRQLLAKWSPEIDKEYTDEQRNDIFLFIEQIIFVQNYQLYFPRSWYFDIDTVLPVLTDKTKIPEFKSIGKIFGFYSADALTRILNSILKKDRFIFLTSHNHVGLLYINDNNKIEFFDINRDEDDIVYKDLSSVVNYFASDFPEIRADALLPLRLYAFTTNPLDKDFPSVHEIAKLCENNEIAYSPKIPGYLGGISSINLSDTEEYKSYFADQISSKTNSLTKRLILTANCGSEKFLNALKKKFVDIDLNVTDHLGQNMLMHAIIGKKYPFVELLLKEKIKLNMQDIFGWTALMYAGVQDDVETFTKLLLAGCDPLIKDNSGKTVINHIQKAKNSSMMETLISRKVIGVDTKDEKGQTALFYAAVAGQEWIVKMLLFAGADLSIKDKSGKTAREYAKNNDHGSVVLFIDTWLMVTKKTAITSPPDDSKTLNKGKTPLMIASRNNEISDIKKLLESKVDVNETDEKGRTALFYAAAAGHEEAANELLNAGADPLIKDKSSKTARHYAGKNKKLDLMYQIMRAEVDKEKIKLNMQDIFGWTALMYAAVRKDVETFTKLLLAGCDPLIKDDSGKTVINHIQEAYNSPMMVVLISLKVIEVDSKNEQGQTALFYAAVSGQEEIVEKLLLAGADLSIQDKSGKTAREYAIDKNHQSVVSLIDTWLIKKTVTTSPPDDSKTLNKGKTPLMIASRNNEISDIKKLLESKVDVNETDEKGRTALFYAAAVGHEEAANELLNAGADPLIEDKSSKTARHYAGKNKKLDLMHQIMLAEVDAELKLASPSSSPRDKNRHVGIFNKTSSRSQSGTKETSSPVPTT